MIGCAVAIAMLCLPQGGRATTNTAAFGAFSHVVFPVFEVGITLGTDALAPIDRRVARRRCVAAQCVLYTKSCEARPADAKVFCAYVLTEKLENMLPLRFWITARNLAGVSRAESQISYRSGGWLISLAGLATTAQR